VSIRHLAPKRLWDNGDERRTIFTQAAAVGQAASTTAAANSPALCQT